MTSCDDQVKAYIKKIMHQLSRWMQKSKISKLVIVITSKETGEHVERWQFDVSPYAITQTIGRQSINTTSRWPSQATHQSNKPPPAAAGTKKTQAQRGTRRQPASHQKPTKRSKKRSKRFSGKSQAP